MKFANKKIYVFGLALALASVFSFFMFTPTVSFAQTAAESCASGGAGGGTWNSNTNSCSCPAPKVADASGPSGETVCVLPSAAQAISDQATCQAQGKVASVNPDGDTVCISPEAAQAVDANATSVTSADYTAATGSKANSNTTSPCVNGSSNPITDLLDYFRKPECGFLLSIANAVLSLSAKLLYLAGIFLNFAASFTLNLSSFVNGSTTQPGLAIQPAWATIRDLMNIVFIFVLLWISIQTILGLGDARKLLASIIISALLINFSLFFTKVVIDVSNVVALQFYTGITGGTFSTDQSTWTDGGISDQFMSRLKLTTIYDAGGSGAEISNDSVISVAIFGSIFIIISAFVFFTVGLMLAARSAVLILLMVTSPIGFIGGFLPQLKAYTSKWQTELINQSLFAPLFFMMIWIVLKITAGPTEGSIVGGITTGGKVSFADTIASQGSIAVVFNFIILIAFVIAALNVAKELSGKAGGAVSKLGATAIGAVAGGAGGWALRNSVGKLSQMAARSETLKNWSESKGAFGFASRMALSTAKLGQSTSFDARALADTKLGKAVGTVTGAAGVGVDFGKASGEGGRKAAYDKAIKEKEAVRKEEAEALKAEIFPGEDKKVTESKKKAEEERLKRFAERTTGGTVLDKAKNVVTLSATATRGSTKAASGVEKDLKKRQDQQKNLDNRIKRIEDIKTNLGKTTDADVIEHYQEQIRVSEETLETDLNSPSATPERIEQSEKRVKLLKGKLAEFENNIKERDRIGEALGKKPDEKKP